MLGKLMFIVTFICLLVVNTQASCSTGRGPSAMHTTATLDDKYDFCEEIIKEAKKKDRCMYNDKTMKRVGKMMDKGESKLVGGLEYTVVFEDINDCGWIRQDIDTNGDKIVDFILIWQPKIDPNGMKICFGLKSAIDMREVEQMKVEYELKNYRLCKN